MKALNESMIKRQKSFLECNADSYIFLNAEKTKVTKIYQNSNFEKLIGYQKMLEILQSKLPEAISDDNCFREIFHLGLRLDKNITFEIVPLDVVKKVNSKTSVGVSRYISGENLNYIVTGRGKKSEVLTRLKTSSETNEKIIELICLVYNQCTLLDPKDFDFINVKLKLDGSNLVFIFTDIVSNIKDFNFEEWEHNFTALETIRQIAKKLNNT